MTAVSFEQQCRKRIEDKKAKDIAKEQAAGREQPLIDYFVRTNYLRAGERLLRKTFISVLSSNRHLLDKLEVSLSDSRSSLAEAFLSDLSSGSLIVPRAEVGHP